MTGSGRTGDPEVTVVLAGPPSLPRAAAVLDSLVAQSIRRRRPGALQLLAPVESTSAGGDPVDLGAYADLLAHRGPARGRYLFFLGAGELLAERALERLVALADRTGADVVLAGSPGGEQALFERTSELVGFTDAALARSLPQARLFRRAALEAYGLLVPRQATFAPSQRLPDAAPGTGPDLPFALEACLRSRRVAVLGGPPCLLVALPDLPARPWHEERLRALGAALAVAERLAEPGAEAAALRGWAFGWELPGLLRPDFLTLEVAAQRRLCAGVGRLLERHCPPAEYQALPPRDRLRLDLARRGRAAALRRLIRYQAAYGEPAMHRVAGEERSASPPAPLVPSLVLRAWRGLVPGPLRRRLRRRPGWRGLAGRAYARWGQARP
ncbi:hypothetical protein OG455_25370 [Kitasatospora sp. NBC_01287]|uniref:hypothetical protein n=1 Tax=Kitasatospora sp. NBC_01287 TaxID=2903573 RepID=UPI0022587521|nr:hypothetical protein [Kitasatospora sp. NBC_01287]MCX4748805.1 hypothetical protein [Kitasatospora sp. NBC_01287]